MVTFLRPSDTKKILMTKDFKINKYSKPYVLNKTKLTYYKIIYIYK